MANFQKHGQNVDGQVVRANLGGAPYELGLWGPVDASTNVELDVSVSPPNPAVHVRRMSILPGQPVRVWQFTGLPIGRTLVVAIDQGGAIWSSVTIDAAPAWQQANVLSQAGLNFIARHEAFRAQLYNDAVNFATIGYGHLVHRGPVGSNPAVEGPFVHGITQAQGLQMLNQDVVPHVAAVNAAVQQPLTQAQFDALVSFSFNVGAAGMRGSQLVQIINHGGYGPGQIANAFGLWIHGGGVVIPGLVNRRNAEANLFNNGQY
jgi:GH24 family phage-related lysozyme (muramidase)